MCVSSAVRDDNRPSPNALNTSVEFSGPAVGDLCPNRRTVSRRSAIDSSLGQGKRRERSRATQRNAAFRFPCPKTYWIQPVFYGVFQKVSTARTRKTKSKNNFVGPINYFDSRLPVTGVFDTVRFCSTVQPSSIVSGSSTKSDCPLADCLRRTIV